MRKKLFLAVIIIILIAVTSGLIFFYNDYRKIGKEIDSYKGVPIYYNGIYYTRTYGKHYSKDNYYYGRKWQCVEYIKRFYYDAKGHKMPEIYGNAKDFFDKSVPHGGLNKQRNLIQYKNGENVKPQEDDLIVFTDTKYGHVAIISEIGDNYIEVVQQNIYGKPRERHVLKNIGGQWFIGEEKQPAGWLRKK